MFSARWTESREQALFARLPIDRTPFPRILPRTLRGEPRGSTFKCLAPPGFPASWGENMLRLTTIWKRPLLIMDFDNSLIKARMNWLITLRRLLYSTVRGALLGLAVCFFLMLRLGLPGQPKLTGYVFGLFLVAGAEVGVLAGMLRLLIEVYAKIKARKRDSSLPHSQPIANISK